MADFEGHFWFWSVQMSVQRVCLCAFSIVLGALLNSCVHALAYALFFHRDSSRDALTRQSIC